MGGEGEQSCQLTLNVPEKKTTTTQRGEGRGTRGGGAFSDKTVPSCQLWEETHLIIAGDINVHVKKKKHSVEAKQRARESERTKGSERILLGSKK